MNKIFYLKTIFDMDIMGGLGIIMFPTHMVLYLVVESMQKFF